LNLLPNKRIAADDRLGKGMDLALTTLLFLGLGYLLDRWLGTRPVFMISLFLLAFAAQMIKLWYDYDAQMKVHEAERIAARKVRP
jgi:F0F1-type ATP synthase assembly protein I